MFVIYLLYGIRFCLSIAVRPFQRLYSKILPQSAKRILVCRRVAAMTARLVRYFVVPSSFVSRSPKRDSRASRHTSPRLCGPLRRSSAGSHATGHANSTLICLLSIVLTLPGKTDFVTYCRAWNPVQTAMLLETRIQVV